MFFILLLIHCPILPGCYTASGATTKISKDLTSKYWFQTGLTVFSITRVLNDDVPTEMDRHAARISQTPRFSFMYLTGFYFKMLPHYLHAGFHIMLSVRQCDFYVTGFYFQTTYTQTVRDSRDSHSSYKDYSTSPVYFI